MATVTANNQADYKCQAHCKMARAWGIVRDVGAGTLRLREAGSLYLPAEKVEKAEAYNIRLNRAILFNAFDRALHSLVGMVFRKEPKLDDSVPEVMRGREAANEAGEVEGQLEDCDRAGSHWTVFAKELFTDAMRDGHAFLMTDMPGELPAGATSLDEQQVGQRPYWVKYKANQAVNWRTDSKGRLLQITFEECTWEADGDYGEAEVYRYRVLRPGSWELYQKVKDPKSGKDVLALEAKGTTSLNEIPVAVVYSRKTGVLTSQPPLLDLAITNIAHFQKYSDYSIGLHLTIPVLGRKAGNTNKKIEVIGHYTIFEIPTDGDLKYVEPTGAGLAPQRTDLLDLEEKMAVMGAAMLARKTPTPKTATEEILSHVKEESDLATAARSLKDGLELALKHWAMYLGKPSGGSVSLGATVEELMLSPEEIRAFGEMVVNRVISKQTVREILKEADKLPETFNEQEELKRLEQEAADEAANQQNIGAAALAAFNRG